MECAKFPYLRTIGSQILCLVLIGMVGVASAGNIDDVRKRVYEWRNAWQHRDIKAYMSYYSQNFHSKGLDFRSWMQKKKQQFNSVRKLRVDIIGLGVFIEGDLAVAGFIQRYHDSKISDIGEKTLTMVFTRGKWKITSEIWKPLKAPLRITKESAQPPVPEKTMPQPSPVSNAKQNQTRKVVSQRTIMIKSIKFEIQNKLEKLFIASNKYFVPKILTAEGDHPEVVIDIKPVSSWNGPYRTSTNGNLVRQIRTHLHAASDTLRIVLDLNPSENYHIDQIYYEKKNIYCIEIR